MGKKKKLIPVGVGYYKKEQWTILKSIAADPERLEETYEEWLEVLKKSVENFKKAGLAAIPIEIDVLELNNWCMQKGIPLDGPARAQFITHKTQELGKKNNTRRL